MGHMFGEPCSVCGEHPCGCVMHGSTVPLRGKVVRTLGFDDDMALRWLVGHEPDGHTFTVEEMCEKAPGFDPVLTGISAERVQGYLDRLVELGELSKDGDFGYVWPEPGR